MIRRRMLLGTAVLPMAARGATAASGRVVWYESGSADDHDSQGPRSVAAPAWRVAHRGYVFH